MWLKLDEDIWLPLYMFDDEAQPVEDLVYADFTFSWAISGGYTWYVPSSGASDFRDWGEGRYFVKFNLDSTLLTFAEGRPVIFTATATGALNHNITLQLCSRFPGEPREAITNAEAQQIAAVTITMPQATAAAHGSAYSTAATSGAANMSLFQTITFATGDVSQNGSIMTFLKHDGTTGITKTITTDANALPIVGTS